MSRLPHAAIAQRNRRHQRRAAFTLIELMIVVVLFTTMATLALETASRMVARKAYGTTQTQLAALDEALVKFYRVYGRLPCPADNSLLATNTSFGLEGSGCSGTGTVQGMVPFRTLNLPAASVMDAYGNRINYVVSAQLTPSSTSFAANTAKIEVRSGALQQPCSTSCTVVANPTASEGAAYFLFSSGEDKRGAVTAYGVAAVACYSSTADTRIDSQNCSAGALTVGIASTVYYDSRYNNGLVTTNYFDDIAVWRTKARLM